MSKKIYLNKLILQGIGQTRSVENFFNILTVVNMRPECKSINMFKLASINVLALLVVFNQVVFKRMRRLKLVPVQIKTVPNFFCAEMKRS